MKIHGVELEPSSVPLDSLHSGKNSKPLSALGQQELQEGGAMREPKGLGRSAAKKMAYSEKARVKRDMEG